MRALIVCAAALVLVGAPTRANAATIGFFNFDALFGPEFTVEIYDGTIAPEDFLTNFSLTLFQNGSVDAQGKFSGDAVTGPLTFSVGSPDQSTPLEATVGITMLVCTDSPICGTGFDGLAFDSAILNASFSQPGYDVAIAPLLFLTPDDFLSSGSGAIDVTQTQSVPEPSTLLLLASGAAFAFKRRRSRTPEHR